jgi:hypothetical protein
MLGSFETAMTPERLLAEGRALARRVVHLVPDRPTAAATPIAYYGGLDGAAGLPWLRVDLRSHPDPECRRDAILSAHADPTDGKGRAISVDDEELRGEPGETALYGIEALELPSLDVLFLRGGTRVAQWLAAIEWDPTWGYNGNFRDPEPATAYERAWMLEHPLYADEGPWAQLGGWPLTWPEASAGEQLSRLLVCRTYRDAEPWIEVTRRGRGYGVSVRIT